MTGRWDRTPLQLLEQQVRDLTAQLAQARKATDIATMRDMLSRAGITYTEIGSSIYTTDHAIQFHTKTGQLVSISSK